MTNPSIRFFDLHTHHIPQQRADVRSIYNVPFTSELPTPTDLVRYSLGLHPWQVTADWHQALQQIRLRAVSPLVAALGEVGLDKVCSAPWRLQMEAFEAQVELAEELKKPLILHVVHAADTILGLHKVLGPRQPWIIHGFRGKPALAEQYLSQGLRLSFGEHFSPDALRICPQGTFFAETDESTLPIDTIWARLLAEHPDAEPLLTLDGCGE